MRTLGAMKLLTVARGIVACGAFLVLGSAAVVHAAHTVERPMLTLDGARSVLAAAVRDAKVRNATGAIAVVDDGGYVVALERIDGTFPAAAEISIGKARTAALFQRPTKIFEDIIAQGRTAMVALPEFFTPLQGGVPLLVDGHVVGAIGVSGAASAAQDEEIARAAADVLSMELRMGASGASLIHLKSKRVTEAFERGEPLVEVAEYKIHASRREAAGQAEIHELETDIFYVLEGSATLVTGGTLVDPQTTAMHELRGRAIEGGTSQRIAKGDVVVVPAGMPHWFKQVDGPVRYYVVKVIRPQGRAA